MTVLSHELGCPDLSPDAHPHSRMTATLPIGEQSVPYALFAHAAANGSRVSTAPQLSSLDAFFADDSPLVDYEWRLTDRAATRSDRDDPFSDQNSPANAAPGVPGRGQTQSKRSPSTASDQTDKRTRLDWLEDLEDTGSQDLDGLLDTQAHDRCS